MLMIIYRIVNTEMIMDIYWFYSNTRVSHMVDI